MKPIPCGLASDAAATVLDEAARRRWLQQLEDDRSRFLLRHPFTASLTLHLAVELVTDPRLPTARWASPSSCWRPCRRSSTACGA